MSAPSSTWLVVGFVGQAVFTARFLVQWAASEREKDSVIPVAFWWLSLAGGGLLLSYAASHRDPVIMLGQSLGLFVYIRNLMLVSKGKRRASRRRSRQAEPRSPHGTSHRVDPGAAVETRMARESVATAGDGSA